MGRFLSTKLVASSFFMLLTTLVASNVYAQEALPDVGRVSVLQGTGSILRDGFPQSIHAVPNSPLFDHDELDTGDNSRAEVEMSPHIFLRANQGTNVHFTSFAALQRGAQIALGTVEIDVLPGWHGQLPEIETPSLAFHPNEAGLYRVSVAQDGTSFVTVRQGHAEVDSPKGTMTLDNLNMVIVTGDQNDPEVSLQPPGPSDDFDDFNTVRNAQIAQAMQMNSRYVNVGGSSALANNGRWLNDPQYGPSWAPNEPSGWEPYQAGEWVWERAYGWTWISDEPWGWAPYHYGSWYYRPQHGWLWQPPHSMAQSEQPQWHPAMVGFVTLSVGVGWVPLGPADPVPPLGIEARQMPLAHHAWQNVRMMHRLPVISQQNFQRHTSSQQHMLLNAATLTKIQNYSSLAPVAAPVTSRVYSARSEHTLSTFPVHHYFVPRDLQKHGSLQTRGSHVNGNSERISAPGDDHSSSIQIIDGTGVQHHTAVPVEDGNAPHERIIPTNNERQSRPAGERPVERVPAEVKVRRMQSVHQAPVHREHHTSVAPHEQTPRHHEHKAQ